MQHIWNSFPRFCDSYFVQFWREPFSFLISKYFDVFYSKYKASNAFVVAKVEGEFNTVLKKSFESWLHVDSRRQTSMYEVYEVFFLFSLCDRTDCWLLLYSGWSLSFQKAVLKLSKVRPHIHHLIISFQIRIKMKRPIINNSFHLGFMADHLRVSQIISGTL